MFESDVFYPQYAPILKVLREYTDNVPMKKYIVDVQVIISTYDLNLKYYDEYIISSFQESTSLPTYVGENKIYYIKLTDGTDVKIDITDQNSWSKFQASTQMLDKHQFEAYKMALTRQFVTIQGPPGTGKSYIGYRIVQSLVTNMTENNFPIVILTFKNDTLDKFLEGILHITNDIVRIGGQSENKKFSNQYNMQNLRKKSGIRNPHVGNLHEIVEATHNIQNLYIDSHEYIINEKDFDQYLGTSHITEMLQKFEDSKKVSSCVENWLMLTDNPKSIPNSYNEQTVQSYRDWLRNENTREKIEQFNNASKKKLMRPKKVSLIDTLRLQAYNIAQSLNKKSSSFKQKEIKKDLHMKFCQLSYLEVSKITSDY